MELNCSSPLKVLLRTSTGVGRESALALLSALSAHPPNRVRGKTTIKWFSPSAVPVYNPVLKRIPVI